MIIYYSRYAGGREESRRLLKKAIAEYTGDTGKAEQLVCGLKTGEHGKPYIEGFDHFSVSHTGDVWAVLFDMRECGLDIQLSRECDAAAISRRVYAPEDAERIARLAATTQAAIAPATADAENEFFRLWTRREALAKALGGSVYDSGLPSVSSDNLSVNLKSYMIFDISLPDMEAGAGQKLFGAVCVEDVLGIGGNIVAFEPLQQEFL